MKRIYLLVILSICIFQIFGAEVYSQSAASQRRGVDYFDYSLGVEAWLQANQQIDIEDSDLNQDNGDLVGDCSWQGDTNLFGPIGEMRIVNTGTMLDRLSISAKAMFGKFDVYDSNGFPQYAAPYFDLKVKYTDVMVRGKFDILPKVKYFQLGIYASYHYKQYKYSQVKPSLFKIWKWDEEEMYGGGVGVDTSILFGNSGIFLFGNGEWIPFISFMNVSESGMGYTLHGGLGYSIAGGIQLPITVTFLAGYRVQEINTSDYFDENVQAATGDIILSW
jgi:hypothetical protein